MKRLIPLVACVPALVAVLVPGAATASTANTLNWSTEGEAVVCGVAATSIRCTNGPGYGFTMSPGHLHLFSPPAALAPKNCGSVSYTFPHTDGHGHAALNNLTAVDVSCLTARAVANDFLVTGKPPRNWHATLEATLGEEVFTRGKARVRGDVDS